ncbi:hypothetical protein T12_1412 [Trichinella patagoniensis]|uniref:Uncharacterized protein n=1 Tax=Trichinella patagoniensis TaxID=990121 RepID=A0A0V0ZG68_9BILA|nr:hypothetical protein T12_1412 [Trichinella patagoniensis]
MDWERHGISRRMIGAIIMFGWKSGERVCNSELVLMGFVSGQGYNSLNGFCRVDGGTEILMDDGLRAGGNSTLDDWERNARSILQL